MDAVANILNQLDLISNRLLSHEEELEHLLDRFDQMIQRRR